MKASLPDQTRISQVHLRTADLERVLRFYSGVLGLRASHVTDSDAIVSGKTQAPGLLVLSQDGNAAGRVPRSIGLFHFALRYPMRNDLAYAYRRIVEAGSQKPDSVLSRS